MKRVSTIAAVFLIVILLMNVFSFLNINQRFVSFLNSSIQEQTNLCGNYMETHLGEFESDLNRFLYEQKELSEIFRNDVEFEKSKQGLQVFYSKYNQLITNIFIFDNHKNYFGLYIDDHDEFVVDTFPRQRQQKLTPRDMVESKKGLYIYHFPYFENDEISGNIIVEVDFGKFAQQVFNFYPIGQTITWQWVVSGSGEVLYGNLPENSQIGALSEIADSVDMIVEGLIQHTFSDSLGRTERIHSSYYPLSIFNQSLGIVFSVSQKEFNRYFIFENLLVMILAFFITNGVIIYLLLLLRKRIRSQESLMMSEIVFRQIIESFPVGIMIIDDDNIIRNINSSAQNMLFIGQHENLVGKDFSKLLLVSNKYLLKDDFDSMNSSDYLYYEREGIETVIYRVERKARIGGEELQLVALIDVSAIERSRKQEVAANKSKSDFLASMSHEIRTPMNGILGMVESLQASKLSEQVDEKVRIIKKSSDLLMTIINDILDFSKIEAGKMMLEEIPFLLREEVGHVVELFKPLAADKGLKIETEILSSVPDKLIGDPFRLRQVISNLVSNAVKFTEKGKIIIGADLMESYQGSMQLLFWVDDTGIGIPNDKLKSIFGSYTQSRGSVSRKFGGTGLGTAISKQLVELMNGEIWVESPSRISSSEQFPGSRFSFTIEVYSNEKIKKNYSFDSIKNLNQLTALFLTKEPNPEKNSINKILINFGINLVTKIYQDSTIDAVVHHLNVKKDLYQFLVIADKNNLDGFALAKRLKDDGLMDSFPAMMVCNNDQPGNHKISKKLGIDYYLIEPYESKEVFDVIQETFIGLEDHKSLTKTLNSLPGDLSILMVEDNLINQKVGQSIFKNIGYEIDLATNGLKAIEMVREKDYDIIFMDLFMPECDGFEATIEIRKMGIKVPIIAMSADTDDQRKADTISAGMDAYLDKPARVETVKELLINLFSTPV